LLFPKDRPQPEVAVGVAEAEAAVEPLLRQERIFRLLPVAPVLPESDNVALVDEEAAPLQLLLLRSPRTAASSWI
jgi:hypothetical protein